MLFEENDSTELGGFAPDEGQPPSLDSLFEARLGGESEENGIEFPASVDEVMDVGLYFIATFADL